MTSNFKSNRLNKITSNVLQNVSERLLQVTATLTTKIAFGLLYKPSILPKIHTHKQTQADESKNINYIVYTRGT